jgi:hypothetical protein
VQAERALPVGYAAQSARLAPVQVVRCSAAQPQTLHAAVRAVGEAMLRLRDAIARVESESIVQPAAAPSPAAGAGGADAAATPAEAKVEQETFSQI